VADVPLWDCHRSSSLQNVSASASALLPLHSRRAREHRRGRPTAGTLLHVLVAARKPASACDRAGVAGPFPPTSRRDPQGRTASRSRRHGGPPEALCSRLSNSRPAGHQRPPRAGVSSRIPPREPGDLRSELSRARIHRRRERSASPVGRVARSYGTHRPATRQTCRTRA